MTHAIHMQLNNPTYKPMNGTSAGTHLLISRIFVMLFVMGFVTKDVDAMGKLTFHLGVGYVLRSF